MTRESRRYRRASSLYATREDWAAAKTQFEQLADKFDSLRVQLLADGPLPWLAAGLENTEAVNLLQGDFALTANYGERWRQWRTAALLAAGLLAAHVTAQALQIHRAHREAAALDSEIAGVFSSALPSEPLQDPRRQMQSRLDRIRKSGSSPEYFLRTLQTLGGALAVVPKTSIDALSYREETLDMKVSAPSLGGAVAIVAIRRQAGHGGRDSIVHAGGLRNRSAPADPHPAPADARMTQAQGMVRGLAAA